MDKITKKLIEIETKLDLILKMVKQRNEKSNNNTSPDDMEYIKQKTRVEALIGKARNEKTIEDSQNQISNIPIGEVIGKKPIPRNKKER